MSAVQQPYRPATCPIAACRARIELPRMESGAISMAPFTCPCKLITVIVARVDPVLGPVVRKATDDTVSPEWMAVGDQVRRVEDVDTGGAL